MKYFTHTINATGCAIPRILICILEYYQNEDGTISIPECLIPFSLGHKKIYIKRKYNQ